MNRSRNGKQPTRAAKNPPEPRPADQPGRTVQTVKASYTEASYSGPLPPASELAEYDRILPGAAERIVSMAERFAEHRQELEKQAMQSAQSASRFGQKAGLSIVLAVLVTCGVALWLGHERFATALGSWTIVALAAVFVVGKVPGFFNKES